MFRFITANQVSEQYAYTIGENTRERKREWLSIFTSKRLELDDLIARPRGSLVEAISHNHIQARAPAPCREHIERKKEKNPAPRPLTHIQFQPCVVIQPQIEFWPVAIQFSLSSSSSWTKSKKKTTFTCWLSKNLLRICCRTASSMGS